MNKKDIQSLSMEELWGSGNTEKVVSIEKIIKPKKLYCLYLGKKQYVALSPDYYMIVFGMRNADIFDSLEEAEDINRRYDINAEIIDWHEKERQAYTEC